MSCSVHGALPDDNTIPSRTQKRLARRTQIIRCTLHIERDKRTKGTTQVKRRPSSGMNLNICSMLNHTSGVPFVPRSCSSTQNTVMRSRFAGLSAGMRVQVSSGPLLMGDRTGMASGWAPQRGVRDPRRPLVPVTTCSYRGWVVPAAHVRTNSRTKSDWCVSLWLSPPGTISRGVGFPQLGGSAGNALPQFGLPPVIRVPSGGSQTLLGTRPNGAPRVRPVSSRSQLVAGLGSLILLTKGAGRTLGRHCLNRSLEELV